MTETEMSSESLRNMGNKVDRALDDKGKKPSQFEVVPDPAGKVRPRNNKPPFIPLKSLTDKAKKPLRN